ncbi:hypothetical protein M096_0900 [Parabacteroides distasonis str. 3999B T(B) 6]|nr:hypothetical protein M096_0900 [Parabacteroides distasonis str. 3999B T(B) 6]
MLLFCCSEIFEQQEQQILYKTKSIILSKHAIWEQRKGR